MHLGFVDAAVLCFRRAVRLSPTNPDAQYNLGHALAHRGEVQTARQHLEAAVTLDRTFDKALVLLGSIEMSREDFARAEMLIRQALGANGQNAEAHAALGHLLQKTGRYQEAVVAFGDALKGQDNLAGLHRSLATCHLALGQHAAALKEVRKAVQEDPAALDGWLLLGDVYQAKGQATQARSAWRKALAIKPDCVTAEDKLMLTKREPKPRTVRRKD